MHLPVKLSTRVAGRVATTPRPCCLPTKSNDPNHATGPARTNPVAPHRPPTPTTLRPRPAALAATPATATPTPASASAFDWHAHWYPVAALDSLHADKPNQVYLLGQRLVVWRDASATWRAFADFCPHRGVPLSEGRLEEGGATLACAYHGWRFEPGGACVDIPQAIGPAAVAAAVASPKACAVPFPVSARPDGLLWVWPRANDFAAADATPTSAPAVSEAGSGALWMAHWFVRDVPFGVTELLENGEQGPGMERGWKGGGVERERERGCGGGTCPTRGVPH